MYHTPNESKLFRCLICGATILGAEAFVRHAEAHGLGLRPQEALAPSPDDGPHDHSETDRPARAAFTAGVSSAVTSYTVFDLGLDAWRPLREPFAFLSLSALGQVSGQPFVLQGPACRECGNPVRSWDQEFTAYCSDCFITFPEKPETPRRWHWKELFRRKA